MELLSANMRIYKRIEVNIYFYNIILLLTIEDAYYYIILLRSLQNMSISIGIII